MFDNVVVGIEEYEHGRDAIELAKALVSPAGHMTLVYVEVVQDNPPPEADSRPDEERQRSGLHRLERLCDETGTVADVARIQAPSVRTGLHNFAAKRGADLIVIGAGPRNPVSHIFLGDDARAVLDGAPCEVAVAPYGYASQPRVMMKVGVGYDGSPESKRALALGRRIAEDRRAALSTFEAVRAPGVKGLRDYASSVDLLVLGSHSYSPPEHLLQRSTSQRLADDPSSPLLVLAATKRPE